MYLNKCSGGERGVPLVRSSLLTAFAQHKILIVVRTGTTTMTTRNPTEGDSRTVSAVDTTCAIIEEIRKRDGAGVTELADALDLSKSAVHHHLATLENQNFLRKHDGQYRIGLRFLAYGGHARTNEDVFETGKETIDRLTEDTGETARIVVENAGYGLTIYQRAGDAVEDHPTHVGMIEYLHSTAAGKAFLAALPDEEADTILSEHGLPAMTPNTITDRTELERELDEIKQNGIAFDDGEQFEEIRCVASTFTTDDGDLLGAVSVSGPVDRIPESRFRDELPRAVRAAVAEVEPVDDYRFRHEVPCIARTLPK